MANKRMFTMKICDSDAFLDMPLSSQCLYFHLCMRADDDGFIGNPKRIKGMIGASDDDLKLLIAKRFLLVFADGVIVIKHWKMHNTIQKDRYTPTPYQDELSQLFLKSNKSYSLTHGEGMETKCIQNVSTDIDIGLDTDLEKESDIEDKSGKPPRPQKHKYGEYNNVLLTDEELEKLKTEYSDYKERIERLSSYVASTGKSYKSHYATIRNWARKDAEKGKGSYADNRASAERAANDKWGKIGTYL